MKNHMGLKVDKIMNEYGDSFRDMKNHMGLKANHYFIFIYLVLEI